MPLVLPPKTKKRSLNTFDFDRETKRRLSRIKRQHGITYVAAVSRGLFLLEQDLAAQRPALANN